MLTKEGADYLPEISRAFDVLTDATEAVAPALNGRKLSIGVPKAVMDQLPKGWPRHSKALAAYVRETRKTEDLELIWLNELDAFVFDRKTGHANLSEQEIVLPDGSTRLFYITRPGLADCRQTRAVLEDLTNQRRLL